MNFRQPAGISTGQEVFSRTRGVEPKERRIYEAGFTFSRTRGVEPTATPWLIYAGIFSPHTWG